MHFIKSLYQSFKQALTSNEEIQKLGKKYPRLVSFLGKRLDRAKFVGLPLTILGLIFIYVFSLFIGSVIDFVFSNIIVNADVRVNTLLYVFRNASAVKTFIWITLLGESKTIIVFTLVASALLWLGRKKWQIVTLWLAVVGAEGFTFLTKLIFHRPRPTNAVFLETSNSFPSGHATAAVAFYGFIAYLLFRQAKKKRGRVLIVLFTLITIIAIGFSRLYLGVHYVSDVWTGYLVGLLWLIIGISINELKLFPEKKNLPQQNLTVKYKKIMTVGLLASAAVFYLFYGLMYRPKYLPVPLVTVEAMVSDATNIFADYDLPRYTETLIGSTQEPTSFIITAKDDVAFVAGLRQAGWSLADTVNFHSTWELVKYVISNKEYPTAPMTPSFWNKQVHNFGFEKSTATNSARQRHHARFWKTNLTTLQGENIYVGTASLDTGIKWLVTHKISPDIDTERELLFTDLQQAGVVKNFTKVKLVSPILGKNFSGDQFFTDGEAYFIGFKE